MRFRSNRGNSLRIGRFRADASEGRRAGSPERLPTAARCQSEPNSVLRTGIRAGIGSGRISASCVVHLGLQQSLARLRAARAVAAAGLHGDGRRRAVFRLQERVRSMTSSAKGAGEGAGAHRGLGLAGEAAHGGRRRGPSSKSAWSLRRGSMQGVFGLLDSTSRLRVLP
jgi:hypothetical protein